MSTTNLPFPSHSRVYLDGDRVASRYNIASTRVFVYCVYEAMDRHSTITTLDVPADHPRAQKDTFKPRTYAWFGRLGTRPLPSDIEALPYAGPDCERVKRCEAWRDAQHAEAVAILHAAFPESMNATKSSTGELELVAP